MAAGSWIVYNSFKEFLGDGTIDLDGDTFIMGLSTDTYTPALTHAGIADITNELSGSGYARKTLSATWSLVSSTVTFDCDDQVWTASGGPITARYAWIFDDTVTTPTADPLVCYSLLDTTPADVTATDGNTLTVAINASGVFTLSGAAS
jgi:hypothetical protein